MGAWPPESGCLRAFLFSFLFFSVGGDDRRADRPAGRAPRGDGDSRRTVPAAAAVRVRSEVRMSTNAHDEAASAGLGNNNGQTVGEFDRLLKRL